MAPAEPSLAALLPELLADVEGALVRIGRGAIADQLREARIAAWSFDDFAQATYLALRPGAAPGAAPGIVSLHDEIGVNVDLDESNRPCGLDVIGYEHVLERLREAMPEGAPRA